MSTSAPIDFYVDFSSPYSYIASEWIEALAARHGRTVRWHAVLLGVTFQAAGAEEPGQPSDQARVLAARLRALGALRRRAVHLAGEVSGRDAERGARLLVARGERSRARRELGAPLPARLLHARHRRPLERRAPEGARRSSSASTPTRPSASGPSRAGRAASRRRATTRSRKASSARRSSSSTASRSGATTGATRSSAGSARGRSEGRPDGAARLPAHAGRTPTGSPTIACMRRCARSRARTTRRRGRASSRAWRRRSSTSSPSTSTTSRRCTASADAERIWATAPAACRSRRSPRRRRASDQRFIDHVDALARAGARRDRRDGSRRRPDPARAARPRHRPPAQPPGAPPRPGARDARRHRRSRRRSSTSS